MSTTTDVPSIHINRSGPKTGYKICSNISFNQTRSNGTVRIDLQENAAQKLCDQGHTQIDLDKGFPQGSTLKRDFIERNGRGPQPKTMGSIIDTHDDMVRGVTFMGSSQSVTPGYRWDARYMLVTDPYFPFHQAEPKTSNSSLQVPPIGYSGRIAEDYNSAKSSSYSVPTLGGLQSRVHKAEYSENQTTTNSGTNKPGTHTDKTRMSEAHTGDVILEDLQSLSNGGSRQSSGADLLRSSVKFGDQTSTSASEEPVTDDRSKMYSLPASLANDESPLNPAGMDTLIPRAITALLPTEREDRPIEDHLIGHRSHLPVPGGSVKPSAEGKGHRRRRLVAAFKGLGGKSPGSMSGASKGSDGSGRE